MNKHVPNWRTLFDEDTLSAAKSMCLRGKVKKPDVDDRGFYATVRDSWNHKVSVWEEGDGIAGLKCDCPESAEGKYCVHMAAALLYLEDKFSDWDFYLNEEFTDRLGLGTSSSKTSENKAPSTVSVKKVSKASSTPRIKSSKPTARNSLEQLSKLHKEDSAKRALLDNEENANRQELESYRFFDVSQFREGLGISSSLERQAQKLFENNEVGNTRFTLSGEPGFISYDAPLKTPEEVAEAVFGQVYLHVEQFSKNYWRVTQVYSWNRLIHSTCHSWNCLGGRYNSKSRLGHELCVHEVAALMAVENYLRKNDLGDATTDSGRAFLDSFSLRESGTLLRESAALLKMSPQVRIDEHDRWSVQFQIGEKRLYKIKNLPEFLQQMDRHETQQFGKNTILQLGREYLDESSHDWLKFIESAMNTLRLFMGSSSASDEDIYYYERPEGWQKLADRIPLFGEILDRFADTLGSESVDAERSVMENYWNKEKHKFALKYSEGQLRPKLTVEPWYRKENKRFEGIRISGQMPSLLYGSEHSYFLDEDTLIRIPAEEAAALEPLAKNARKTGLIRIQIGRSALSDFYRKVLPALQDITDIEETDPSISELYLPEEPSFVCYLDVDEDCVMCRPAVYYGAKQHSPFDVYDWRKRRRGPEHYRDGAGEEALISLLEKYLPERDDSARIFLTARGELPLFEFLDHGLAELLQISEVKATDRFMRLKVRKSVPFQAGVSVSSGIMDLTLTSEELTPDELVRVFDGYKKKLNFIRLKNGDFLRLDQNEEIRNLVEMMQTLGVSPKEFAKGKMQIPLFRALYLDLMLEQIEDLYAERDSHFKKLIKEFKTVSDADYDVPVNLKPVMRKYQKSGYRWMRTLDEYHFGGILADDMGLGKTLQAISVILADHNEIVIGGEGQSELPGSDVAMTSLVVCPASLVYNWEEELHRFAPSLKVLTIVGNAQERKYRISTAEDFDVLVTSYDLLKRDIAEYEGMTFRFEFIDEAQYIKNHGTAAAKSVKLIRARTRFALTGTPIENRLSELWSIFDYLMPGFLYDYNTFRKNFELPIAKERDEDILERLRKMVTPFILRRSKKEVLKDLPDKLEEIRYAGFEEGGTQQKLYNAQVVRMREDLQKQTDEDFSKSRIQILAELMRIRQICCDPSLCFEAYGGDSAKRLACMELVHSVIDGEHKALIFSQFTSMLALLEKDLQQEGIPYYVITGSTPKEKRLQMAKAFNNDSTPVFLISLKAGGTGLNLTGADVVIHYDPWWNAAVQNQATDRAHRIGQDKVVTVYQLILKNTIEERIVRMQQEKRDLAEDILSSEAAASSAISREDLLELLGLETEETEETGV